MPYNVIAITETKGVITHVAVKSTHDDTAPFKASASNVVKAIALGVKFFVNKTEVQAYPADKPEFIRTVANESVGDNLESLPTLESYEKANGPLVSKQWNKSA